MKVYAMGDSRKHIRHMKNVQETEDLFSTDVVLVSGGDGSMLKIVDFLCGINFDVPIIGYNTGHVGFLSNDLSIRQLEEILSGKIESLPVQKRNILEVFNKEKLVALNEVVIQPQSPGRLFDIDVTLDYKEANEYVRATLTYRGDGIIISTASGSTAYNISAGGPIVTPGLDIMTLTPLNPFSLASRPLVVPGDTKITLTSEQQAYIVLDGRVLAASNRVAVNSTGRTVKIVKYSNFMEAIQNKLGWNHSIK